MVCKKIQVLGTNYDSSEGNCELKAAKTNIRRCNIKYTLCCANCTTYKAKNLFNFGKLNLIYYLLLYVACVCSLITVGMGRGALLAPPLPLQNFPNIDPPGLTILIPSISIYLDQIDRRIGRSDTNP